MARPSVQDARREQVLQAFLSCAARHGIEGATLEKIAEAAGLSRPLIRHHLGNRQQMVEALADHVIAQFDAQLAATRSVLEVTPGIAPLLDILFYDTTATDPDLNLAYQALVQTSQDRPALKPELLRVMQNFYDVTSKALMHDHPTADHQACQAVAHGIVALYLTVDSLSPLAPPHSWRDHAAASARLLVSTLP